jgi:hypothetical protein
MSLDAVRARAASLWHSRWLTVAFVVGFAAFVGRGLVLGRQDLRTPEQLLDVRCHLVRSTKSSVIVQGRATIATVRESGMRAMFVGPSEVEIRSSSEPVAMLELALEWEEVGPGDQMQLIDDSCGVTYLLADLQAHQTFFTVPLPQPNTHLRLVPSRPTMGYSLAHYRWVTDMPLQPFVVKAAWEPLRRDEVADLQIGCGWWPHQGPAAAAAADPKALVSQWPAPATERWSRRYGCVRIEPAHAGPHLMGLVFRRPDPKAPLPRLFLDGICVWDESTSSPGSRVTANGELTEIEFRLDLSASSVLGIECPGPYRSRQESGIWADWHRVAYEVKFDRCWLHAVP